MSSFYDRLLAFAYSLQPDLATALLKAFREFGMGYKEGAVADAIAAGDVERASNLIASASVAAVALIPVRSALRDALIRAATYIFRDTPKGQVSLARASTVTRFDALDPVITEAAEAFEAPILEEIATEVRQGVLAEIRAQLALGVNPQTVARELRDVIGISGQQVEYLQNYRVELQALSRAALDRVLTDGRIDRTVAAAIRSGTPLTEEQITRAMDLYAKNLKAHQATTLTRTTALNAMREGQRAAWKQAVKRGAVDEGDLIDTWHTTMDGRERPTHAAMHLKTKAFSEPWIVPGVGAQDYPGQSEYGCRCVVFTRPRIRRASGIA